jgi:hypothetical protein
MDVIAVQEELRAFPLVEKGQFPLSGRSSAQGTGVLAGFAPQVPNLGKGVDVIGVSLGVALSESG